MRLTLALCLILITSLGWAQVQQADSLSSKLHQYDATLQNQEQKLDSIQSSLHLTTDSLELAYKNKLNQVDSVSKSFQSKTDSIQQALHSKLSILDVASSKLNSKIDSVKSLNLPTDRYTHKLDSINQAREKVVANAEQKIQSLKAKTTDKLKSIELPPELQSKVSGVTNSIDGFKLPGKDLNISSLNLPDNPLGKVGDINVSNSINGLSDVGKLPEVGDGLKDITHVTGDVGGELKDVSKVTGEIGGYQKDLQAVTSGNLGEVKQLPQALENKAADVAGIGGIQGETKVIDQYKDQLGQLQNPDALKQQAVEKVQQAAVDHFAGKEQVLQQAMEKMAKYKQKYSSLQSLSEIGKKRPNEMHDKPIKERLLPGIGLQIFRKNDLIVDFNPYLGYRFNGRLTSGMGWNQRIAYDGRRKAFHSSNRVFGPRAFAEYNLFKGFFPRLEVEAMNAIVPNYYAHGNDFGRRQWIYSAFVGLKKNYRFLKKVNGTSIIMINLYNPYHRSPYLDIVNMRFGFEFPMKKKVKSADSAN